MFPPLGSGFGERDLPLQPRCSREPWSGVDGYCSPRLANKHQAMPEASMSQPIYALNLFNIADQEEYLAYLRPVLKQRGPG
jgi:hypothetical protein